MNRYITSKEVRYLIEEVKFREFYQFQAEKLAIQALEQLESELMNLEGSGRKAQPRKGIISLDNGEYVVHTSTDRTAMKKVEYLVEDICSPYAIGSMFNPSKPETPFEYQKKLAEFEVVIDRVIEVVFTIDGKKYVVIADDEDKDISEVQAALTEAAQK